MTLNTQQQAAVSKVVSWFKNPTPFFQLFGYAGTGKTFTVKAIIEALGLKYSEVAFLAPTNKACVVMRNRFSRDGIKIKTHTCHSAIWASQINEKCAKIALEIAEKEKQTPLPKEEIELLWKQYELVKPEWINKLLIESGGEYTDASGRVHKAWDRPLDYKKLIVVDECSMVPWNVSQHLIDWGIPIIALGDPGQLEPVGEKNGNIFLPTPMTKDPDVLLTEIMRNDKDSPIIYASQSVRSGIGIPPEMVQRGRIKGMLEANIILAATHATRLKFNSIKRAEMGYSLPIPHIGEMVFAQKSHYKRYLSAEGDISRVDILYNGLVYEVIEYRDQHEQKISPEKAQFMDTCTIILKDVMGVQEGIVSMDDFKPKKFERKFSGGNSAAELDRKYYLDFGYAITVHASQGSEWSHVMYVHQFPDQKRDYTAITRAQDKISIVGVVIH
jgi:exodeoxyribonuclease V